MISWGLPHPIRWVASDAVFRGPFRFVMRIAGAIPKAKEQSDLETIQELLMVKARGGIAGIFPEGTQNWNGLTGDFLSATTKLVRLLKVPVVVPRIQGGYLSKPRWSWSINRCGVELDFRVALTTEEIKGFKLKEIEERLKSHIDHDEYAWQRKAMKPLKGEDRSEHLELALWCCPSCRALGSFVSQKNTMTCKDCSYAVNIDRWGFFQYPPQGPSFPSPGDWDNWQREQMEKQFRESLAREEDPLFLKDQDITLMRGSSRRPFSPLAQGEARLYRDRLEFAASPGEILTYPFSEVKGITVFKQHKLEFSINTTAFRFHMPSRSLSAYKWYTALRILTEMPPQEGREE